MSVEKVFEVLENATLAELQDELQLIEMYPDRYPKLLKELVLAEIAKRFEQ
jgi:hypothetical protein